MLSPKPRTGPDKGQTPRMRTRKSVQIRGVVALSCAAHLRLGALRASPSVDRNFAQALRAFLRRRIGGASACMRAIKALTGGTTKK